MIKDYNYNKVKVLNSVVELAAFIQEKAIPDAKKAQHPLSVKMFGEMVSDLQKHSSKLQAAISGLSKEDKFE